MTVGFLHCILGEKVEEYLIRKEFAMQPEAVLFKAAENASDYYSVHAMEYYNWKTTLLVTQMLLSVKLYFNRP